MGDQNKKALSYDEALQILNENKQQAHTEHQSANKNTDMAVVAGNTIIILLIVAGIIWWLRKDYKKYKEQSKLWIFFVEIVVICIFVPALLKPLFKGLWANLYILFN